MTGAARIALVAGGAAEATDLLSSVFEAKHVDFVDITSFIIEDRGRFIKVGSWSFWKLKLELG